MGLFEAKTHLSELVARVEAGDEVVITRHNSPFAEFLMMAPKADQVVPMFTPLLLDEPVPVNGRMKASALDRPGFGVRLNPECALNRPYPR